MLEVVGFGGGGLPVGGAEGGSSAEALFEGFLFGGCEWLVEGGEPFFVAGVGAGGPGGEPGFCG